LGRRPLLISGGIQMIICQVWKIHSLMQISIMLTSTMTLWHNAKSWIITSFI
jgi:hypothetical protein